MVDLVSVSQSRPPLTASVKGLYALGSVATGLVNRSLSAFLMLFYSQVLGLPAATVAAVIMFATVFDAFMDPLVGQASDNLRSRFGRRHPFMYAAALPTMLAFALLWAPPAGLAEGQLIAYLLACLLVIRFSDTLFELPSLSLAPELTSKYEERSVIIALRKGCEMVGGYLFVMAGYQIFMRETADGGGGLTAKAGYAAYGLVGAAVICVVIVISTRGTQKFVPWLSGPPTRKISPRVFLREASEMLGNRALLIIAAAGMLYYTGVGVTQSLSIYFNLFFWQLSQTQVALVATVQIPASLFAVAMAPLAVRAVGKKLATILPTMVGLCLTVTPVTLRLLGIMPANGDPLLFPLLMAEAIVSQVLLVIGIAIIPSMLADVVEDAQVRTGRRAEGFVFAAENFARKLVSGLGVFIAGTALTLVNFPRKAHPGAVEAEPLLHLGLIWVCAILFFLTCSMICVAFFPIDKRRHEENLRLIAEAEGAASG